MVESRVQSFLSFTLSFSFSLSLFSFSSSFSLSLPLSVSFSLFCLLSPLLVIFSFYPKEDNFCSIHFNFFSFFFFAVEAKVLDHNLVLVPGEGIEGKVWFNGCLDTHCLPYVVWLEMSVWKGDKKIKTVKTGSIRPGLEPFPVNGLLSAHADDMDGSVTVQVNYWPASSYPYSEDFLKSKFQIRQSVSSTFESDVIR